MDGSWRLALDYAPSAQNRPRYGHGRPPHRRLEEIIARHRETYRATLATILRFQTELVAIGRYAEADTEPYLPGGGDWLGGLDGAALYALLRSRAPERYVEVGSGSSTTFVARAKRDGRLATHITSIDPAPRRAIDQLCDQVLRCPLEDADLSVFAELRAGDVVFFDGSHRVFMNSDVVTFFLDVLPSLPAGVLVGIHDIYLPEDYPPWFADRYYSEQYMLAVHLLAGTGSMEPVLASHHASQDPSLSQVLAPMYAEPSLTDVNWHGSAFWFLTTDGGT